jgi:hypothetical protein
MTTRLPIYNRSSFSSGTDNLTLDQANTLFCQKNPTSLIVSGSLTAGSETVVGELEAASANITSNLVAGQSDSIHSISGQSTFNSPILYHSSIGVGQLSNSKHLVTKEYADGGLSGLLQTNNTWTGTNAFVAGSLQLGKNDNTTAVSAYGNITVQSGSTLTDNGSVVLNGNNQIGKSDNSSTNTIYGPTTCNNNFTVANCMNASAGVLTLSQVPVLQGNYSQPGGASLATKAYVDQQLGLTDTICYGQQAFSYFNGTNYTLEAPNLGTTTTTNSTGSYKTFFINFPTTSIYNKPSVGNITTTPLHHGAILDINYWIQQMNAVTGSSSNTNNTAIYSSAPTNGNIPVFSTSNYTKSFSSTFIIGIQNGALTVYCPSQSITVWNNTGQGTGTAISVLYDTSQIMSFLAVSFFFSDDSKIQVRIGFPNMRNNPTKTGWIANCGFTAKLRGSMPCTSAVFVQDEIIATPSQYVNSTNGGAYLSKN